jgi:hypothetical protein
MGDLQAGRGRPAHELVGMHLGSAGIGVVEVAPGQHVDLAHPGGDHLRRQLVDRGSGHVAVTLSRSASAATSHPRPGRAP